MSGQNPTYPKTFIYKRDAVQVATESSSKIEIFKDLRDGKLYYLDRNRVPVEISTGGGSGPGTNTNISNANLTFDAIWQSDLAGFAWGIVDSLALTNPFAIQDNLDILAGGRSILGKSILTFFGLLSGYYFGKKLEKQVVT